MQVSDVLGLGGFVAVCFAAASSGAFFRPGTWYEQLAKPSWCPPNWLFAPAWSLLFIMIAVSGWLVWRNVGFAGAGLAFAIYGGQLLLNAAWSAIFFGARRVDIAMGELSLLWMAILANILVFYPLVPEAAYLLIPYLCWVSFAGLLNFSIWRLNAGQRSAANALSAR